MSKLKKHVKVQRKRWTDFYWNKYKTLFLNLFQYEGLDYQEAGYVMGQLFKTGSLAAFKLDVNEEVGNLVGFGPYVVNGFGLYGRPLKATIINTWNVKMIPSRTLTNDEDVSLIKLDYLPVDVISTFVEQMVELRMTYNTNVKLHKMPYIITGGSTKDEAAIHDILQDEIVVQLEDTMLSSVQTNTPYILDKLYQQMVQTEHELLTVLGVDNVKYEKGAQMNVDEINANNDEINAFRVALKSKIEAWLDNINDLFGTNIKIKVNEDAIQEFVDSTKVEQKEQEVENDDSN